MGCYLDSLKATKNELGSSKNNGRKAKKRNGDEIPRKPSERPPFNLHTWTLHPIPNLRLFRQIKTRPFHSKFLNTSCKCSVFTLLPLQLPWCLPIQPQFQLHHDHEHPWRRPHRHRRNPPFSAHIGIRGSVQESEREGMEEEEVAAELEDLLL